ncbi:rhomboid family intramembrane serine protease [Desulfitobacterium sp. AusDCA]|uniref:rhomboid family intramembrane serine protease n=1 Tax=Desulfitobacterium sp. AusDCA TaxID=3240383 RepID=UPI003DA7540E
MSLIYLQLLSKLVQDGWKNENYSSGWSAVSKDNRVLLFLTYLPKQPIPPLPLDAKLQRAEVFLFCPQGLNAQDLDQDVLRNIQSWFIDLQTGYVFPYPPNPKQKTWDWLVSYFNTNDSSSSSNIDSSMEEVKNSTSYSKKYLPYITFSLTAINLIVFIIMTLAGGTTSEKILILFGAKVNELILEGQVWRFFTSMFIHIGFFHLAFNLYALWMLGSFCEERFGRKRFLLIYLFTGITGSIFSFLFTDALSAGASGAIFGLLGALVPYAWKKPQLWKSGLGKNLIVIIIINLGLGLIQPGIDIYAHLGGLICGLAFGFLFP